MDERRRIWFPAKRYGWGWGPPVAWQGWAVLFVWVVVLVAVGHVLVRRNLLLYLLFVAAMAALLVAVCYAKGERPRGSGGDDDRGRRPRSDSRQ